MGVEYDARFGIGVEVDVQILAQDPYDYLEGVLGSEPEYGFIIWGDHYEDDKQAAIVIKKDNLILDPRDGELTTLKNQIEDLIEFVRCAKIPTVGGVGLVGGLYIY